MSEDFDKEDDLQSYLFKPEYTDDKQRDGRYSCSFIILQLNHWCHVDYFIDILITFLGNEVFQL